MTVQELIYDALRLIGALNVGEGPSSAEHSEDLRALNNMLDTWNTERLNVFRVVRTAYTLATSKEIYTMGTGGDINAARPVKIELAGVMIDDIEQPLSVIGQQAYADIRLKTLSGSIPEGLYDDRAFPSTNLHLWPIPPAGTVIVLYTWQALSSFAALSDTVSLPPGYTEAITYNLALRLAPRYRDSLVSPYVMETAREAKANIKRLNAQTPILRCEPVIAERSYGWDIHTGDWRR